MINLRKTSRPAEAVLEAATPLLKIEGLSIEVQNRASRTRIIDDIGFSISPNERLALVGESGSGKSVTARAILNLDRNMRRSGSIWFERQDMVALPDRRMRSLRSAEIGMVFQDPMTSLDPLMTIGDQVAEVLRIRGIRQREARDRVVALLTELGVANASERYDSYPHEFSGGMRQRVVIAMALIAGPRLLIADEPTTALDVRVQKQVLEALGSAAERRQLAVLFISHDLSLVAEFADRILIMYSGRIVEQGSIDAVLVRPRHPYTAALLAAAPSVKTKVSRLEAIPGTPPPPAARPSGCAFHPRCSRRFGPCDTHVPQMRLLPDGTGVACHLYDPTLGGGT